MGLEVLESGDNFLRWGNIPHFFSLIYRVRSYGLSVEF